ncbi:helix-turn-helix domain-containing protein [Pseudarthrobacter sp. efr-133-R2A-89]|uniref:helix-turn-helix domain-containing protein n=1 Tax=Pseudarthrobacter sp. efr-133-R2A-89 TaxID=3040302 RepID=UPI0033059EC3
MTDEPTNHRFMTPTQVAEELNVKPNQVHALIKAGELRAFQVGGRGMWRIGRQDVEDYIAEAYRRTAERIAAGELEDAGPEDVEGD